MSRIGRKPINIPAGVTVTLASDNQITVKGPKGELKKTFHPDMIIKVENDVISVERPSDDKKHRSLHGLTRTLIYNMIEGVTQGYSKSLEVQGIGYKVQKQGNKAVFNIGFSHPVEVEEIDGIKIDVTGPTTLVVSGIDKQAVGQFAAEIRGKKPPEPYHGKGIRYVGEYVRMKEGKAGKK
ncbi:MAG: 50S ribosomal protein L6 [Clostridiales bacterium]|nr:50S ribosomal protein L6 [Clostridiales bacterium]